jgi:hypothetical protein
MLPKIVTTMQNAFMTSILVSTNAHVNQAITAMVKDAQLKVLLHFSCD